MAVPERRCLTSGARAARRCLPCTEWGTWQVVASDIAESMLQHGRDSARVWSGGRHARPGDAFVSCDQVLSERPETKTSRSLFKRLACGLASTQSMNAHSRQAKQIAWGDVGTMQKADLAELADWVEGLRAAGQTARVQGNITLAEALDITRFEVYEGYLDEELDHQQSQAAARRCR